MPRRRSRWRPGTGRGIVLRPPILPPYGSVFLAAYVVLLAVTTYFRLRRPHDLVDSLFHWLWIVSPLLGRISFFRLELRGDGMLWRFGLVTHTAAWNEIDRITVDPHTEEAFVYRKGDAEKSLLPVQLLSFDDELTAMALWHEQDLLQDGGPQPPGSSAPGIPWKRLGMHPGMLLLYVLALCAAFVLVLVGAFQGNPKMIVAGVALAVAVLPRFWFPALRVDDVGIHIRRWPLPRWHSFAWRDVASVHGGTEARPLRLRDAAGTWHRTAIVVDRVDFFALRAALAARSAEAVFA